VSYVAAAYGIVALTLTAYGFYLIRERRRLQRSLSE
jgi:CcmD family protein